MQVISSHTQIIVLLCTHTYCHHFYLAWLKVIFHTVLEAFSFRLQRRHDEAVSHKVSRVTDSFTGPEACRGIREREDSYQ